MLCCSMSDLENNLSSDCRLFFVIDCDDWLLYRSPLRVGPLSYTLSIDEGFILLEHTIY